jgi:hypothetical protein
MVPDTIRVGSRVCIVSYCSFRGLRGTVRMVDLIDASSNEDPFCFYQIDLEGTQIREPVWLQNDEVALLDL